MASKTIDEEGLQLLITQNAVREARVARILEGPRKGRWCLSVRLGGQTSRLVLVRSQREPIRTWASMDTLVKFADAVGLVEVVVEL